MFNDFGAFQASLQQAWPEKNVSQEKARTYDPMSEPRGHACRMKSHGSHSKGQQPEQLGVHTGGGTQFYIPNLTSDDVALVNVELLA